jgi:hypothetical protein
MEESVEAVGSWTGLFSEIHNGIGCSFDGGGAFLRTEVDTLYGSVVTGNFLSFPDIDLGVARGKLAMANYILRQDFRVEEFDAVLLGFLLGDSLAQLFVRGQPLLAGRPGLLRVNTLVVLRVGLDR